MVAGSWLAVMNGLLAVSNLLLGAPLDGRVLCDPVAALRRPRPRRDQRGAPRSAQRAFPVLSSDARLAGVIVAARLARLSREQRAVRRVEQTALPVPAKFLAAPDDPAFSLAAAHSPLGWRGRRVPLDHDRILGMVTTADLHQAQLRYGLLVGAQR